MRYQSTTHYNPAADRLEAAHKQSATRELSAPLIVNNKGAK